MPLNTAKASFMFVLCLSLLCTVKMLTEASAFSTMKSAALLSVELFDIMFAQVVSDVICWKWGCDQSESRIQHMWIIISVICTSSKFLSLSLDTFDKFYLIVQFIPLVYNSSSLAAGVLLFTFFSLHCSTSVSIDFSPKHWDKLLIHENLHRKKEKTDSVPDKTV